MARAATAWLRAALLALVIVHAVSAPLLSDVLPAAGGAGTVLHVVGAGLVPVDGEPPLCRRAALRCARFPPPRRVRALPCA
jgi:hypothetical protein